MIWPAINLYISVVLQQSTNTKYTRYKNSFIKEQHKYMQIQAAFEHALQVNSSTAQVQSFCTL